MRPTPATDLSCVVGRIRTLTLKPSVRPLATRIALREQHVAGSGQTVERYNRSGAAFPIT